MTKFISPHTAQRFETKDAYLEHLVEVVLMERTHRDIHPRRMNRYLRRQYLQKRQELWKQHTFEQIEQWINTNQSSITLSPALGRMGGMSGVMGGDIYNLKIKNHDWLDEVGVDIVNNQWVGYDHREFGAGWDCDITIQISERFDRNKYAWRNPVTMALASYGIFIMASAWQCSAITPAFGRVEVYHCNIRMFARTFSDLCVFEKLHGRA